MYAKEIHQSGVLYNSSISRALQVIFPYTVVLRIHDHIYELQYNDCLSWSDQPYCVKFLFKANVE